MTTENQECDRKGAAGEGLRARKHRQTRERICRAALDLFLEREFDGVTLDAIAAAAEVSRRTLFHYFASKEAIVQAVEQANLDILSAAAVSAPVGSSPLEAARLSLLAVVGSYQTAEAQAIDRLMQSSEALLARKQANYERQERALHAALCARWPDPAGHDRLRLIAMACVGALRIAAERWRADPIQRGLADHLDETLTELRAAFAA